MNKELREWRKKEYARNYYKENKDNFISYARKYYKKNKKRMKVFKPKPIQNPTFTFQTMSECFKIQKEFNLFWGKTEQSRVTINNRVDVYIIEDEMFCVPITKGRFSKRKKKVKS
jgi:hypothetical protein